MTRKGYCIHLNIDRANGTEGQWEGGWEGKLELQEKIQEFSVRYKYNFLGSEMGIRVGQVEFWIKKEDAENVVIWFAIGFALG